MIDNVLDALEAEIRESLAKEITDESLSNIGKKVRDLSDEMFDHFQYRIQEDLARTLSEYVKGMATRVVEELLKGNEREMRRYLECEVGYWNGRSDGDQGDVLNKKMYMWHLVINGKIFECSSIAMRRDIVAAHRDLITSERIKDLEDQVASLVAQVNKANKAKFEIE